ncbi:MAG: hemerythrin domain-containing protein [Acidimicrobiales bacterium]|nr:hemerythrin domain-containing protein [Acidimicrobiales bacterium]
MRTIFEALRNDHDTQREIIARLVETHGDTDERRKLFDELSVELEAHAIAEERHFYVPLMQDDLTQEKARHSVSEHKELDDYLEQLRGYDMSGSQWLQTANELRGRLEHHLDEEEHEVFQMAGKALSDIDKQDLAASYEDEMTQRRSES